MSLASSGRTPSRRAAALPSSTSPSKEHETVKSIAFRKSYIAALFEFHTLSPTVVGVVVVEGRGNRSIVDGLKEVRKDVFGDDRPPFSVCISDQVGIGSEVDKIPNQS